MDRQLVGNVPCPEERSPVNNCYVIIVPARDTANDWSVVGPTPTLATAATTINQLVLPRSLTTWWLRWRRRDPAGLRRFTARLHGRYCPASRARRQQQLQLTWMNEYVGTSSAGVARRHKWSFYLPSVGASVDRDPSGVNQNVATRRRQRQHRGGGDETLNTTDIDRRPFL